MSLIFNGNRVLTATDSVGLKWNLIDGSADFANAIHPYDSPNNSIFTYYKLLYLSIIVINNK